MNDVQVLEGKGPHPTQPVDEHGRRHGVWIITAERMAVMTDRDQSSTQKVVAHIPYKDGEQDGPVKVFFGDETEPKFYKFVYGYHTDKPISDTLFFGPQENP
jgi:hypothetical protein